MTPENRDLFWVAVCVALAYKFGTEFAVAFAYLAGKAVVSTRSRRRRRQSCLGRREADRPL